MLSTRCRVPSPLALHVPCVPGFPLIGSAREPVSFARNSGASMTAPNGLLDGFGPNQPRIGANGLLIEPARTNLLPYSSPTDLEGAINHKWEPSRFGAWYYPSVTPNSDLGPDMYSPATKLVWQHRNTEGIGAWAEVVVGRTYYASVYMKAVDFDPTGLPFYLTLNLGKDGLLAGEGAKWATCNLTEKWQRFEIGPYTIGASPDANELELSINVGDSPDYIGKTIYVWGAQIEEGTTPTTVISTNGAPATRPADVCNVSCASLAGLNSYGAATFECSPPAKCPLSYPIPFSTDTGFQVFASALEGWDFNELRLYDNESSYALAFGDRPWKIAITWTPTLFKLLNLATGLSVQKERHIPNLILADTKINVGGYSGSYYFGGYIRDLKIWRSADPGVFL